MEWINVKDRLPDFNEYVLCYDTQKIYIGFRENNYSEYNEHWSICEDQCCSCTGCTGAITHWMPLPHLPKE